MQAFWKIKTPRQSGKKKTLQIQDSKYKKNTSGDTDSIKVLLINP